jgi:hypothetical protein
MCERHSTAPGSGRWLPGQRSVEFQHVTVLFLGEVATPFASAFALRSQRASLSRAAAEQSVNNCGSSIIEAAESFTTEANEST